MPSRLAVPSAREENAEFPSIAGLRVRCLRRRTASLIVCAAHESGSDAVDGSSTGTRAPSMQALLGRPSFGGARLCKRSRLSALISLSQCFQVHGVDADGNVLFAVSSSDDMFWCSFRSCRRAWLESRPVRRHIIGRVNFTKRPADNIIGIRWCLSAPTRDRN